MLIGTYFFYFSYKSTLLSCLLKILNLKIYDKQLKVSLENSFKINSTLKFWSFLRFILNLTMFGVISDLFWINLCFSVDLNFEILNFSNTSHSNFFQFIYFLSGEGLEYLTDPSLIEHSVTTEKNSIDFFTDFFGFYKDTRYSYGSSSLLIDNISTTYYNTLYKLKNSKIYFKKKSMLLIFSIKYPFFKNYFFIVSKSCIQLNTKFSEISFFLISKSKEKYVPINYFFLKKKEFHHFNHLISHNMTKSYSISDMIKVFIDLYWNMIFFSIKHEMNHYLISWILSSVIFIQKKISKMEIVTCFIRLILTLNIKSISKCFQKLAKKIFQRKCLFDTISLLRFNNLYFFFSFNYFESNISLRKLIYKNFRKTTNLKNLEYEFKNFIRFSKSEIERISFSIKNIKIFSIGDLIENSNKDTSLPYKFETGVHSIVLKFTGFNNFICLVIYLLSIIKIKASFNYIVEWFKKKNQKLRFLIKNKANKFMLIKVLTKSSMKRLKISNIAILENLISLKLLNINYLPRTLFEKKLFKDLLLGTNFKKLSFFYHRIRNWKQTTIFDRNSLQKFFRKSSVREQKIILKTIFKVKKAKELFNNAILNFCSNLIETISFFISFTLHNFKIESFVFKKNFKSFDKLEKIIQLNFFCNLFSKRIKFRLKKYFV